MILYLRDPISSLKTPRHHKQQTPEKRSRKTTEGRDISHAHGFVEST
jgi:hypothetical protein